MRGAITPDLQQLKTNLKLVDNQNLFIYLMPCLFLRHSSVKEEMVLRGATKAGKHQLKAVLKTK